MVRPRDWNGETTVMDKDGHAIEVPLMDGGTRLCPHKGCRCKFDEGEVKPLILHRANKHGVLHRFEKTCKECKLSFTVQRKNRDVKFCSRDCAQTWRVGVGPRIELRKEIKQLLTTEDRTECISVYELREIATKICDKQPHEYAAMQRDELLDAIRTRLGSDSHGEELTKDELSTLKARLPEPTEDGATASAVGD